METFETKIIARIKTDFPAKFGVPRQSGLFPGLAGEIIFEPEYRDANALSGIEGFSHLWLIWQFSENARDGWSPTVRPPRLGGNKRMGVFATRSPFRPNPIGLSCVRLTGVRHDSRCGTVLLVDGADMISGTPILDIKPYLPLTDCRPEASGGFAAERESYSLEVDFPQELLMRVPENKRAPLEALLSHDPRPAYQNDPERVYGFGFAGMEIKFSSDGKTLHVINVEKQKEG